MLLQVVRRKAQRIEGEISEPGQNKGIAGIFRYICHVNLVSFVHQKPGKTSAKEGHFGTGWSTR